MVHMTRHPQAPEAIVLRHIDWCRSRHLSPNTIQARLVALRNLAAHLQAPVLYATPEQLADWQQHASRRIATSTLRGYISNLREFYTWAIDQRLIGADPTTALRPPRAPRYLPRPLDDTRLHRALDAAPADIAAILALARWCGLRAVEIAGLTWRDVDLTRRELRVLGKGRRDRIVYIPVEALPWLRRLLDRRGFVIRRRDLQDGPNAPHRISHMANEHLHEAGIDATLHALRHSFATAVLEATGDLRATQEACGHESPATTSIYAKVRPLHLRRAIEAGARIHLGNDDAEGCAPAV